MRWPWIAVLAAVALGLAVIVLFAVLARVSQRPPALGLIDGHLRPCPRRSNCVSTEDRDDPHGEAPFAYSGDVEAALDRLAAAIAATPRARVTERKPGYLRAEFRSRLFGFVDDVEARPDPAAGVLHLRSASRVGRGDHGANRARLQDLRRRF